MGTAEITFHVAGLEVLLRAVRPGSLDGLAGFYGAYPSSGAAPGLILDIERVPGFAQGRPRAPEYPAFRRSLPGPGRVGLERFDAEGELLVPHEHRDGSAGVAIAPVRGRFRVGDSPNSLEAAVRIGMSVALPRLGGLILHASAVAHAGQALVFAGVSGAGKSTLAAMLRSLPGVAPLADELIILSAPSSPLETGAPAGAPAGGSLTSHAGVRAHVTPFLGSAGLPHGLAVPVGALYVLAQAPHHQRHPLARREAARALLRHILVYVAEPDTAAHVLGRAARICAQIPCFRLEFAKDLGVASTLCIPC